MTTPSFTKRRGALVGVAACLALVVTAPANAPRGYAKFSGVNQWATVAGPVAPNLNNRSFTIEFWSRNDNAGGNHLGFLLSSKGAPVDDGDEMVIGYTPEPNSFRFGWGDDFTLVPTEGDYGVWVHWACSYDAATGTRRIFKNGELRPGAEQVGVPVLTVGGELRIASAAGGRHPFEGAIDELRIWSRALDVEELQTRMNRALNPSETGGDDLLAYYPMDALGDAGAGDPASADLADMSGKGAHADGTGDISVANWLVERNVNTLVPTYSRVVNSADEWPEIQALLTRGKLLGGDNVYLLDLTGASGTMTLGQTLRIHQTTIIEGPGAGGLSLDGDDLRRAFVVEDGATLVLRGVALQNFRHAGANGEADRGQGGSAGYGGAVLVEPGGQLHCEDVEFIANEAIGGAGSRALKGGLGGGNTRFSATRTSLPGQTVAPGGIGGAAGSNTASSYSGSVRQGGRGADGVDGSDGDAFVGGGGGLPGGGGGGGGGVNRSGYDGGNGGAGGNGGDGGAGGFGGGAGAGGNGGGGGGGGDIRGGGGGTPGTGGDGGDAGSAGSAGFGGGTAAAGIDGWNGSRGYYDSGNGGPGGAGDWSNQSPRGAGGGAGLGGAIFLHPRASISLRGVRFVDNLAKGGRGIAGGGSGRGIGSAAFLMDGAFWSGSPDVRFEGNTNTDSAGNSDVWSRPIYGAESPLQALRGGTHPAVGRPLYYSDASYLGQGVDNAVFRYRWTIWERSATGGGSVDYQYLIKPGSGATDPDAAGLFTPADRAAVAAARTELERMFAGSPDDAEVRRTLFDISYDSSAVLGFLAEFLRSQTERDANNIDPVLQSTLDEHIDAYVAEGGILDAYRGAFAPYADLIADPAQFAAWVDDLPVRHFKPLQFIDDSDPQLVPPPLSDVPNSARSSAGYKDLVLLFDLLAAHGKSALRAAELYHARGLEGDRAAGLALASTVERYLFTNGSILKGALPDDPGPALEAALGGWGEAINSLAQVQTRLESEVNALGFTDDFLLLIGGETTDSFQYLYDRLEDKFLGITQLPFPAGSASYELGEAVSKLDGYNASQSQFVERRDDKRSAIEERLGEIGSLENPGGEIEEQLLRIENAKTEVALNRVEVSNLHEEVRIAIETNEAVKEANLTIADIKVNYIDRQRGLDREIAQLEAAQASADRAVGILDVSSYGELLVGGANMAFQGWADQQKIKIADQKAELAGAEVLEIVDVENVIRDAELDGFIKTRLLDLKQLALESLIATNSLTQELNRLAALVTERNRLEKELLGLDASLADRYYADPVHGLRFDDAFGRAQIAFRRAQLWSFIALRAFEYKWNRPFRIAGAGEDTVNGDGVWDKADLFAARNARDLRDFAGALEGRNADFSTLDPNRNLTTTFRVRKDFFGLGNDAAAVEEFRRRLIELRDNDPASSAGDIRIPFHTVRLPQNSSFFAGAEYEEDPFGGYQLSDDWGSALDKIVWVKIVISGDFGGDFDPTFGENRLANNVITYGGTTYVRNIEVGTLENPDDPSAPVRPDRLYNELTAYETRNYDLVSNNSSFPPQSTGNVLRDTGVEALVFDTSQSNNPSPLADDTFANDKFAERSVAATDWSINLKVGDANFPVHKIDEIRIIIRHQNYDRIAPQ